MQIRVQVNHGAGELVSATVTLCSEDGISHIPHHLSTVIFLLYLLLTHSLSFRRDDVDSQLGLSTQPSLILTF